MSNNNLVISKMTIEDFDQIKNNIISDFDDFWNEQTLQNELNSPTSYYLVAKLHNEIVGFAGIKIVLDSADIMNIVIKKDNRNCGIGYLLLIELLSIAKQKNINTITLEVNENNLPAIHLYEKLGFKKIAERKKYYQNTYDAFIMQIILGN